MTRSLLSTFALASSALFAAPVEVTFYKDVLPVLQNNCQSCHRPGEAGPMSFLTYEQTRPWAKAIKGAVLTKRMPPWHADPAVGHWRNDRTLKPKDVETLISWVDSGAKPGNKKDAPSAIAWTEGWNIAKPDQVFSMPKEFEVPAEGTVDYVRFVVPMNFTEDKWVKAVEVRPGNRAVVHHVIAYLRPKGSKWLAEAAPYEPIYKVKGKDGGDRFWLVGYAPGMPVPALEEGQAILIPAGADLVLEMHYTPNGKVLTDKTSVGVVFAKEAPKQRVYSSAVVNGSFVIPPGADNHPVEAKARIYREVTLTALQPHMHLRGKAWEFRAVYPTGEKEVLLRVPKYDFNWQLTYYLDKPKVLPVGTVIEATAWYDNSPNNPHNPDPKAEVRWGDQSYEEMLFGAFTLAFDSSTNPKDIFTAPKKPEAAATSGGSEE
jgi:hypothetical protein